MHVPSEESKQHPGLQKLVESHEVGTFLKPSRQSAPGAFWHQAPEVVFSQQKLTFANELDCAETNDIKIIIAANKNNTKIPLFLSFILIWS